MNRFTKAKQYHKSVMLRKVLRNLAKAVSLGIVIALLVPIPQVKAKEDATYIIADVIENYSFFCYDTLIVGVEMQDGSIQSYYVEDNIPDEIPTEVVFRTTDIDNFKSYEIVGMR